MPALPPSFEPCFTCFGLSVADGAALSLWLSISENIAPTGETFYRISDLLDVRVSDPADNRIYQ